ncbi:MAG: ArtI protein, partial [Rhodoferax sp.]
MKLTLRRAAALFALTLGSALGAQAQTASTLDTVVQTGVLRACTPGDYKPFSFLRADGVFEGIDADLAQSLGKAL